MEIFYLEDSIFYQVKNGKSERKCQDRKIYLHFKTCDSFSLAPMERVPQNYSKNILTQKIPEIELDGFTKFALRA